MRGTGNRAVMVASVAVAAAMWVAMGAACGTPTEPEVGARTDAPAVSDTAWTLVGGEVDGRDLVPPPGSRMTLAFDEDGVGGVAGCNTYGAPVTVTGDEVELGEMSRTLLGCEGTAATAETSFLDALADVEHAARQGDRLELTGDDVRLAFEVLPPWPKDDVVGRDWRLQSVIPSPSDPQTPTGARGVLRLDADGTASGTTVCRAFDGEWSEWRGDIVMTRMTMRGPDCPEELWSQDAAVTGVLSRFHAVLEPGGRLLLTSAGASPQRLVYRR